MGKRISSKSSKRFLPALLTSLLVASGLVLVDNSVDVAPASATTNCPAGVAITALHGSTLYWDKATGNNNITGAHLGYRVANTSGSSMTNISVSVNLSGTGGADIKLGGGQPSSETVGDLGTGLSSSAYFLVDVAQKQATQSVTATLNYKLGAAAATTCTFTQTLSLPQKRALAANANKLYSARVVAPSIINYNSFATVVVTGNTGTIGAGPAGIRDINLTPVVYPGQFNAGAWKLVDVKYRANNGTCNGNGLIENQLHISSATNPSSAGCAGLYSAAYTFQSRSANAASASQVQAFSYISSGNLMKHTSPFGSNIGLPTVSSSGTVVSQAPVIDLTGELTQAISSGAVGFTADDVSVIAYQGQTVVANAPTFVSGTGPLTDVCLVDPANSAVCSNGPFTVKNLKEDETLGTSDAGTFSVITVNGVERVQFVASNTYYIGGSNATDLPARIVMRLRDSSATPQNSDAFANATVLQGAAPTSLGATQTGASNTPLNLSVTSSGSSLTKCLFLDLPMPEPCTSTLVTLNGTWSLNTSTNVVTFTPNNGYVGTTTIKFGVTDQFGATSISDVTATITSGAIFTLSFSPGTGTGSVASITGNGSVTLPPSTGMSKAGSQFAGWDIGGTLQPGTSYNLTASTTATALWVAAPTLTFVGNAPTSGSVPAPITSSGTITIPGNTGLLEKTGFTFGGWQIGPNTYNPGETVTLSGDTTATAIWTPVFTITFDGNSSDGGSVPASIVGNGSVNLPGNTNTLTRNGFTFLGWGPLNATTALPTSYNLTADVTLYAIWQQNAVTPVAASPTPCVPTVTTQAETGLIGVIGSLLTQLGTLLANGATWAANNALTVPVLSTATVEPAQVAAPLQLELYKSTFENSLVFAIAAASKPKTTQPLTTDDITVVPGSEPGTVEIESTNGDSLQLLDSNVIDFKTQTLYSGSDFNNPATWQALGYGMKCWKLEPFSDSDYFYTLPNPIKLPAGTAAGDWRYSHVMVKAGSLTASSDTYQTDTVFPAPKPGGQVWADINGNGIFDPGGKSGDKSISHIIICITNASVTPVPTATPESTPTPTPTQTLTPTPTPTGTVSPTPTPTQTLTPTPTPTLTPTPTPTGNISPAPTPTPTPTIVGCPEPTPPTASPEPTKDPKIEILILDPEATPTPTPTPTQTSSPTPSPTGSATPSPSATPTNPATPAEPIDPADVPGPDVSDDTSAPCQATPTHEFAFLLTNGESSLCYRVTGESLITIASFGGLSFLEDGSFVDDSDLNAGELANTGFENSSWLFMALLLMGLGGTALVYARRRD